MRPHIEELVYDAYCKKHAVLKDTSFELTRSELLKQPFKLLYEARQEPVLFFSLREGRKPSQVVCSNLLCLQEGRHNQMVEALGTVLSEQTSDIVVTIEDYLANEVELLHALNLIEDHVSSRMEWRLQSRHADSEVSCREISISPVRADKDEVALMEIFNLTFANLCEPATENEISRWIHAPRFESDCYLMARDNNEVVGFIAIELNHNSGSGYLQEIGVLKNRRRTGVGTTLVKKGIYEAVARGITKIGVGVLDENQSAKHFFRHLGFAEVYRRIIMRRGR